MRARTVFVVAVVVGTVATATSCRRRGESASADSTFVHAMIDLRLVTANTVLDSAGRVRARDSVLQHYSTSAAGLDSIARALGDSPDRAVEILRKIDYGVRLGGRPVVAPALPKPVTPLSKSPPATHK
jgi:hypothetical protein